MSAAPAASPTAGVVGGVLGRLSPRQSLAAGALALIATVVAYVYMSWHGDDTTGLVVLACPVIGTLFQHGGLQAVTNAQTAQVAAAINDVAAHPQLRAAVHEVVTEVVPGIVHRVLDERGHAPAVPAPREPVAVA